MHFLCIILNFQLCFRTGMTQSIYFQTQKMKKTRCKRWDILFSTMYNNDKIEMKKKLEWLLAWRNGCISEIYWKVVNQTLNFKSQKSIYFC